MKKTVILVIVLLLLCSCSLTGDYGKIIDESKLDFDIQFSLPNENDEIAVLTTTKGVVKIKLFPDYAPNAVNNFKTLAKQGYYNDSFVFFIEPDVAFMAGTKDREGQQATTIFEGNTPFDNEYTDALWHFSGAVSAMSINANKSDSRFFITATSEVPQDIIDSMNRVGYPKSLVDKYKEKGGIPGLDKNYTVFAQVYEGFDVIDEVMKSSVDENGVPSPDIKIEKIEILKYSGE